MATKAETHRAAHFRARVRESDRWVECAIIAFYEQQTKDEQFQRETRHRNGVGFAANEASRGSYYARWILSGRKLSGIHLTRARKIACRHVLQLVRLANAGPEPAQPKELAENPFAAEEQFVAYEKEQEERIPVRSRLPLFPARVIKLLVILPLLVSCSVAFEPPDMMSRRTYCIGGVCASGDL